ncbi:MAG: 4-hydroxy-3-methylbut-2-enyl diphosphate reductase [Clostridiales bacterium]|nr:4-hydroxy-3-methylbut-2-enyl diphosphate reductase [Clostridiales bacterium]
MQVTLAKSAGFCFGVKRAVSEVYQEIEAGTAPIYTYGPIIHNDEVVRDMKEKGVQVVTDLSELAGSFAGESCAVAQAVSERGDQQANRCGTIIIRSHGVSREEEEAMRRLGLRVVDATCPFVKKIHRLVEKNSRQGNQIVIVGDANHPEVRGIRGWSENDLVYIAGSSEEAENLVLDPKIPVTIVSQTTFHAKKIQEIVEIFKKKGYDINVLNTICNATEERQTEARRIAGESDAMIVIGDKSSSNTQKLFEICRCECENTYYIQTSRDIDYDLLVAFNNVGITAGASTPNNIIEEVSKNVRENL